MAAANHPAQVDADLDKIQQERFFSLAWQIGAKQQSRNTGNAAIFEAVLRHVFDRFFKTEEAGADPGSLSKPGVQFYFGQTLWRRGRRQESAFEVAREIYFLSAIAEAGPKSVRRLRLTDTCQNGCGANWAAVIDAALDFVAQLGVEDQTFGHANG